MPDLPDRALVLSGIGLAGGVVAEAAHSPVIAGGGALIGCAAIVTALGTSFLPQLNLMVSQWRFKQRLEEAEAEGAKRQEELTRMGRELDKANVEIVRLSREVEEIPLNRKLAESAHDAADRALRGLHFLQSSGLFDPEFGPGDVPPVPARSGGMRMLIVGQEDEARALGGLMETRGWDVTESYSVADANRKMVEPHLLTIVDLTAFPDGGGLTLLRRLRRRFPDGKVLVIRDGLEPDDEIRLDGLKPDKVISRPIHLEDITEYAKPPFADPDPEAVGPGVLPS